MLLVHPRGLTFWETAKLKMFLGGAYGTPEPPDRDVRSLRSLITPLFAPCKCFLYFSLSPVSSLINDNPEVSQMSRWNTLWCLMFPLSTRQTSSYKSVHRLILGRGALKTNVGLKIMVMLACLKFENNYLIWVLWFWNLLIHMNDVVAN